MSPYHDCMCLLPGSNTFSTYSILPCSSTGAGAIHHFLMHLLLCVDKGVHKGTRLGLKGIHPWNPNGFFIPVVPWILHGHYRTSSSSLGSIRTLGFLLLPSEPRPPRSAWIGLWTLSLGRAIFDPLGPRSHLCNQRKNVWIKTMLFFSKWRLFL